MGDDDACARALAAKLVRDYGHCDLPGIVDEMLGRNTGCGRIPSQRAGELVARRVELREVWQADGATRYDVTRGARLSRLELGRMLVDAGETFLRGARVG